MKFRIVRKGTPYCIQWYKDNEWQYMNIIDIPSDSILSRILFSLAKIGYPRRWDNAQYCIEKEGEWEGVLIFANEMLATAFIGACKVWFSDEIKEVEF